MLLNALKLAARSGSGGSSSSDSFYEFSEEGFSPLPMSPPNPKSNTASTSSSSSNSNSSNEHSLASSYANSIEAMAATVEAAAINRQRPKRSPKKSPKKKNKGGGGGGTSAVNGSSRHNTQYQGTRKQLFSSSTNNNMKKRVVPRLTAGHLVAILILVPFVIMEAFLSVLVFTYNYNGISMSGVGGGGLTVAATADDTDVGVVNLNVDDVVDHQEERVVIFDDEVEESDEENDVVPPPMNEGAEVGSGGDADHPQAEIEEEDEKDVVADQQQAEIENHNDDENDVVTNHQQAEIENDEKDVVTDQQQAEIENDEGEEDIDTVKSNIIAMQTMLKDALNKLNDTGSDRNGKKAVETLCLTVWSRGVEALDSPDENDEEDNDTLNELAIDAQRCLGGAELVYLSRDINIDSVRKSKVIFESLSDVDPDNANVRAGLGTSLLILGAMKEDASFLKLAVYHLKTASSLCQKGQVEEDQPQAIFQSDPSAMSAAILHNLALANIALGDDVSPVSLLLRSGAIRREDSNRPANLFWNCHHDALLAIEEQAVLMGAKSTTRRQKKKTKSKIPFLSDRFGRKASA